MWGAIGGFLKSLAIALGWAKQADDINTGKKLENADEQSAVLKETQGVADARNDPGNMQRVHDNSARD